MNWASAVTSPEVWGCHPSSLAVVACIACAVDGTAVPTFSLVVSWVLSQLLEVDCGPLACSPHRPVSAIRSALLQASWSTSDFLPLSSRPRWKHIVPCSHSCHVHNLTKGVMMDDVLRPCSHSKTENYTGTCAPAGRTWCALFGFSPPLQFSRKFQVLVTSLGK